MIRFISHPNLPSGYVKSVVCGVLCRELEDYLDKRGIKRLKVAQNPYIDKSVSFHADMLCTHVGGNKFVVDKSQRKLIEELNSLGANAVPTKNMIAGLYPNDIGLNFSLVGECVFGKIDSCDEALLNEIKGYRFYSCKQGYCKCSSLIVNNDALITDDSSVYEIALKSGMNALLISKGDIALPGHDYGFIGGTAAKISKDEFLFFGDVTKHRDYKKIADFLEKYGCKIISLDFPLTDFGGFVLVTEES